MKLRPLLAGLAAVFLIACASPTMPTPSTVSWVWILTGPKDAELQGDARSEAFAGHFANMARLADEEQLLLAGPFSEPRARADHRGIFLMNTGDVAEAQALADTDPAARAGVFRFEVEPFRTADALERVMPMHAAAVEAAGVEEPPPGYHCRAYVLVTGAPAASAESALEGAPVLFAGRLGTGADERVLACLDATTADDASAYLANDGAVRWTVMPWFATNEVVNLRGR